MSKTLVTVIGTGNYQPTTYQFSDGTEISTRYFPYALFQFLQKSGPLEQVVVLLTQEAKDTHWGKSDTFDGLVTGISFDVVDIPKGATEGEAWEIFDRLAGKITEGASIVFDVTHGFRSIPILLLAAMRYLQEAKHITIDGVYYGAFEAVSRDEPKKPVYPLTSFVALLDWANAVEVFNRTGNSMLLAGLLGNIQDNLYRAAKDLTKEEKNELPKRLKKVADCLNNLSIALDFVRPLEVLAAAYSLLEALDTARDEFPQWAKPFHVLLEQVKKTFEDLAMQNPNNEATLAETIAKQQKLIRWYDVRERHLAAALLAREWVVSVVIYQNGLGTKILDRDVRRSTEELLNGLAHYKRNKSKLTTNMHVEQSIVNIWQEIPDVRNDLAHCGMRQNPTQAQNLKRTIQEIIERIEQLNIQGNL